MAHATIAAGMADLPDTTDGLMRAVAAVMFQTRHSCNAATAYRSS
jgi:hypothetical protein